MSSVSGGSIFAALLAELAVQRGWEDGLRVEDYEEEVARPLRLLTRQDLRTVPFLAHLPWNWLLPRFRARHLERLLRSRLTQSTLGDLPVSPRFVFCATDMSFGVNWEFRADEAGSYQAGYLKDVSEWPLARAVAASACFPPIFGPLPINVSPDRFSGGKYKGADGVMLRDKLSLSDGGVYDNMSLEPAWKRHKWVFVSDGGAPFEFNASKQPVRRLLRYTSVVMNQAQSLRKRMFFGDIDAGHYRGVYWSIRTRRKDWDIGYADKLVDWRIARVRTDLDSFTAAEQAILENHGYAVADRKLQKYAGDLLGPDIPAAVMPHQEWLVDARVEDALRASHRRFVPARLLGTFWRAVRGRLTGRTQ